jgi:hypothetical protein
MWFDAESGLRQFGYGRPIDRTRGGAFRREGLAMVSGTPYAAAEERQPLAAA